MSSRVIQNGDVFMREGDERTLVSIFLDGEIIAFYDQKLSPFQKAFILIYPGCKDAREYTCSFDWNTFESKPGKEHSDPKVVFIGNIFTGEVG